MVIQSTQQEILVLACIATTARSEHEARYAQHDYQKIQASLVATAAAYSRRSAGEVITFISCQS
jgi:hypothetical protein